MKLPQLLQEKRCKVPTKTGWIVIFLIILIIILGFIFSIYPFLAPYKPINGEAIIVEGWVPDYCMEKVAALVKEKSYKKIFVTGGVLEVGSYLKDYKTYALVGAETLKKLSIPDSIIVPVSAPYSKIDRTYTSALAFKRWLDSTKCSFRKFDICSQTAHTRRSALLFSKACGKEYRFGMIAVKDPEYEPHLWWSTSKGVRHILDETIAYVYALFFVSFK
ncbi:MAG: YdcF family protein [Chitinispirillaceae bacterium]|nr:YdcF family protein [Chitinispirillaceae bacterium]